MSRWILMINVQLYIDLYRLYINTDRNLIVTCLSKTVGDHVSQDLINIISWKSKLKSYLQNIIICGHQ